MTHKGPVPGEFKGPNERPTDVTCRRCKRAGVVVVRKWESDDGAYDDYEYTCTACGLRWWVEGSDA